MKHEIKNLEHSAVEIKICLTGEELSPLKTEVLTAVAAKAEVPGFRKGKAPLDKVEAQFKDAVKEELTEKVLQKYYEEVVKEGNITPISYIHNVKVEMNENYELTFQVDVYPTVELGEYKGLEVEKETFEMTEEKLNKEIEIMVNSKSKLVDTEAGHKAVMGDTVDLAFEGFVDGVPFEGGKADSHVLKLGSKMFIDTFEDQLVGYEAGQEGEVNVTFPEQYHATNLAGKPAVFKVKVNSIKTLVTPELNDELAKELGFESVEDLKAKKAEEVKAREEARIKNEYIGKLLDKVAATSKVDVPFSMIATEVKNRISEMEQQLSAQGIGMDMYLQMTGMDRAKLESQIAPMAAGKVKIDLILEAIAKAENIEVSEDEVTAKMTEVAKYYGMNLAKLEEELNKHKNYDNFKYTIKGECVMQKAIDLLVETAK